MHRRSPRFVFRAWFLLILPLLAPIACSNSSGHVDTPMPVVSASAAVAVTPPLPDPCEVAAGLRAKVKPFLEEGRLHRTVRLIEKADGLCPKSAPETRAALVTTLAELGKYADARKVAAQIEANSNASAEAKAAAVAAKERCDKLDKVFPDTDDAKKEMKKLYLEALEAEQKTDPDSQRVAKEKYLEAWEAWRPNGQALLSAGFAARKLGQSAEAQRLFDRAIVDGEKAQNSEVALAVPNGFSGTVKAVAWSKDGRRFAVAHENEISIFDMTWREKFRIRGHSGVVTSVAFSPDAKTLASGSADATVKLWDVATGNEIRTLKGHKGSVHAVTYSPDGRTLASESSDNTVKEWNIATGQEVRTAQGRKGGIGITSVASPDGKTFASASQDTVRLWDATTRKLVGELQQTGDAVTALAYSPDGKTLASGVSHYLVFHKVRLWDVAKLKLSRTIEEHSSYYTSIKYSPNGETLAAGFADGTVRLWDVATGKSSRTLYGHTEAVSSVAYSPNGKTLASGAWDKTVRLWDIDRGRLLDKLEGHAGPVASVVFSPDGKTLSSRLWHGDNAIYLWDTAKGKLVHKLEGHRDSILSVAYSPDSTTVASACRDQIVRVWSVADGKLVHSLVGHRDVVTSVAYSPDGKTLASGATDGIIRLWDVAIGKHVGTFEPPPSARSSEGWFMPIKRLAYSADGKTLASRGEGKSFASGADDETALWDVATGKRLRTLEGHANDVFWGVHSPNGTMVALDGGDPSSIRIQRVDNDSRSAVLRAIPTQDAAYTYLPSGHIDFFGAEACSARIYPVCRIGTLTFPFDVCEERFYSPGILAAIHGGNTSYLEPENAPALMKCPTASP